MRKNSKLLPQLLSWACIWKIQDWEKNRDDFFSISLLPCITEFLLSHLGRERDSCVHVIGLIAESPSQVQSCCKKGHTIARSEDWDWKRVQKSIPLTTSLAADEGVNRQVREGVRSASRIAVIDRCVGLWKCTIPFYPHTVAFSRYEQWLKERLNMADEPVSIC